jgi:hypothetical protein
VNNQEHTFVAVDDERLAEAISGARKRLVFAAPGLGKLAGRALADSIARLSGQVTIILDADAEACRIGYGDLEALQALHDAASQQQLPLRRQAGLRIGVLIADDAVLIWSPIARSVEAEREQKQPNGLVLGGSATEVCSAAMGADGTSTLPRDAEIGAVPLKVTDLKKTLDELQRNPPAPFDLARRTRVFSSRFQFVEFELRGAQWAERKINLSSVLLNADLPEALRDVLDTQIRPYQEKDEPSFEVPLLVKGIRVFDGQAKRILVAATQTEVLKYWTEIRDCYLRHLPGFGWLIKRDNLNAFREASAAFEETLRAWVDAFRKHVAGKEDVLVNQIVAAIQGRVSRSDQKERLKELDLKAEVRKGLARMRVIEPHVRIVLKNVAWESTRDAEFQKALEQALPAQDREGWFEEFTAARERMSQQGT